MKFINLSVYLKKLEDTQSRLKITEILSDLFKESSSVEIDKVVYLILGSLAPLYESVVFNIAENMMVEAISLAFKKDKVNVKKLYRMKGDLGNVASFLSKKNESNATLLEVYKKLLAIAEDEGEGSQERKIEKMAGLLVELDKTSVRYVVRIPIGKLRLGFSDKTVLDALSWMESGDKSQKGKLESFYQVRPDVGFLAREVKKIGIDSATKKVRPNVGTPVLPMLAQRLKSPSEMIEKMGKVAVEPKLDGLRIQIHFERKEKKVKAYTRNLNENSWMFPELATLEKHIDAESVILDTEAVGVDETRKNMTNFQLTMTRRRKYDIEKYSKSTPIKFYAFDILEKNGKNLMKEDYLKRRELLQKTVDTGRFLALVDSENTEDPKRITDLNREYKKKGYEGILVKKIDGKYVPGRTGWRWVKMKEAEEARGKLSDTIDCVVMGFSAGRGRRAGFGVGQFLAGIYRRGKFVTITKVGTGLTDKQFKALKNKLEKLKTDKKPKEYDVHKDYTPDYWVIPSLVVELAADDLTKSPRHTSGFAMRFPRLVRFRDDKNVTSITSVEEVNVIYKLQ